jgi:dihydropteroate synthase
MLLVGRARELACRARGCHAVWRWLGVGGFAWAGCFLTRRAETFRKVLEEARSRRGAALMGICNVTPDSFSDGGRHFTESAARARVDALLDEGADFIDVGGESTRPGAPAVPAREQLSRVLDVVRYASSRGACVSIDTTSAEVASACLDAGASAVNDVSCLADDELAKVTAGSGAAFVLMHARGSQTEMAGFSVYPDDAYGDVVRDVMAEWGAAAERAMSLGVLRATLVMDPGLGFAKNAAQSRELLRRTSEIVAALDVPLMIGASRKSFLVFSDAASAASAASAAMSEKPPAPGERLGASIAAALHAARAGALLLRVHDVRATAQALDTERALTGRA